MKRLTMAGMFPKEKIPRLRTISLRVAFGAILYLVLSMVALPLVIKAQAVSILSQQLNRPVSLKAVRLNPFTLGVRLKDLAIGDTVPGTPLFSASEIYLNLEISSLWRRALILQAFSLKEPLCTLVRLGPQKLNITDLFEKNNPPPENGPADKPPHPFLFSISNIQVSAGRVFFKDIPMGRDHQVTDIELGLPVIANTPQHTDIFTTPKLTARVNNTPLEFAGKSKPFQDSLETIFDINLNGIDLPFYSAYLPVPTEFVVNSGTLDVDLTLRFRQHKDRTPVLLARGTAALKNLRVTDQMENPLVVIPHLGVSLATSSLLDRRINIKQVVIREPAITAQRTADGKIHVFPDLNTTAKESDPRTPFLLTVDSFSLIDGTFSLEDDALGETPFTTQWTPVNIELNDLSTRDRGQAFFSLAMAGNRGEEVSVKGSCELYPFVLNGEFSVLRIPVGEYSPYYRSRSPFTVVSAVLDAQAPFRIAAGESLDLSTVGLEAALTDLKLLVKEDNTDLLTIPSLTLQGVDFNLLEQKIAIASMATAHGEIRLVRNREGRLTALPPMEQGRGKKKEDASPQHLEDKWKVKIGTMLMSEYGLHVRDESLTEPSALAMDRITITAENLNTDAGEETPFTLAMRINSTGSLESEGTFGISPLNLDLDLDLKRFPLPPAAAYLESVLALKLLDGEAGVDGHLKARQEPGSELKTSFTGSASLTGLHARDLKGDDLLKWKSLLFLGMNVESAPTKVTVDNIGLTDFFAKILIRPDGTINLRELTRTGPDVPPEPGVPGGETTPEEESLEANEKLPPQVVINRVTLQGGEIDFSDQSITPNFSLKMLETGGRISGLSSLSTSRADVNLAGKLANQAPLEVTGTINPLAPEIHVDLKLAMKNMDLGPLSPYSGKYVGYTIRKGKLFVDTHYLITGTKIDARNSVFLDQFTLGDKVESKDALNVPITLAVSLLKNRKGEIRLDLPVSGDLANPEFKIGAILFKVFFNLLIKAVTSPFALLGAIGGGEELSFQEFDYGSALVPTTEKLDSLATALEKRPALKLEILGKADGERDRTALIEQSLKDAVLAEMKKDSGRDEGSSEIQFTEISAGEYEKYLGRVYRRATFPKPRNVIGFAKSLPVAEMEKLLRTHTEITDGELLELALKRAQAVQNHLTSSGKISPERIFLLEPVLELPEKQQKETPANRVEFSLR